MLRPFRASLPAPHPTRVPCGPLSRKLGTFLVFASESLLEESSPRVWDLPMTEWRGLGGEEEENI